MEIALVNDHSQSSTLGLGSANLEGIFSPTTRRAETLRYSLPPFQRPALLDTQYSFPPFRRPALLDSLVCRLQKKRALLYSWAPADETPDGRDVPGPRYELKDLQDSHQILEYLKSGGRSIGTPLKPGPEKVGTTPPSDVTWFNVRGSHHLL